MPMPYNKIFTGQKINIVLFILFIISISITVWGVVSGRFDLNPRAVLDDKRDVRNITGQNCTVMSGRVYCDTNSSNADSTDPNRIACRTKADGDYCVYQNSSCTHNGTQVCSHNETGTCQSGWCVSDLAGIRNGTPTPTVTPTPPPNVQVNLTFYIVLAGVNDAAAAGAKVRAIISKSGRSDVTREASLTHIQNGIYKTTITVNRAEMPVGDGYFIKIKGEKHIQNKYCAYSGQSDTCGSGTGITIPDEADISFDFTNYPLPAGDVYIQDGLANSADFNKIKNLMSKACDTLSANEKLTGDLDYNNCIDTRDIGLLRETIASHSQDEN